MANLKDTLDHLNNAIEGDVQYDATHIKLYSTDASIYQEQPIGVAFPKNSNDIGIIVQFSNDQEIPLIPRAAGTSLAGQCVGNGLVVDVSRHLTQIGELDTTNQSIIVEPGVIRDELNLSLAPHQLHFGPNTATSNRCTIGGMVGNNSCGSSSITYGSTRDNVISIAGYLSDGSKIKFERINESEWIQKCQLHTLEGNIYRFLDKHLRNEANQKEIVIQYPKKSIKRRNTGYALDNLLDSFLSGTSETINLCSIICGSEGTMFFATEIKLQLAPTPPPNKAIIAIHCHQLKDALHCAQLAMKGNPTAVELMDDIIIRSASANKNQKANSAFIIGEPKAILAVEFSEDTASTLEQKVQSLVTTVKAHNLCYNIVVLRNDDMSKIWALRKAGLGILSNIKGDAKPIALIEDTAVHIDDLPDYIDAFQLMLKKHNKNSVFYAHAGAGELHLRPIINLKDPDDLLALQYIAQDTAQLVKQYNGSNSGEHGDGRLRASFIPEFYGPIVFDLLKQLKNTFDPNHLFNPKKIIDAPSIVSDLRYEANQKEFLPETEFQFDDTLGILRMAEKCNGSADCRVSSKFPGTMCPTFKAIPDESLSTRGRANIVRQNLTQNLSFISEEIDEVLSTCVACKGCSTECPSNVDMSIIKMEYLYQKHKTVARSWSDYFFGYFATGASFASIIPWISNVVVKQSVVKRVLKIAPERNIPLFKRRQIKRPSKAKKGIKNIAIWIDEFSNTFDRNIANDTISLLEQLGYSVSLSSLNNSGRTLLSKGFLRQAKRIAKENIKKAKQDLQANDFIVGIEPSSVLSFHSEYERLANQEERLELEKMKPKILPLVSFLLQEIKTGNNFSTAFKTEAENVHIHEHCFQKSLVGSGETAELLGSIEGLSVHLIPSGCCGMAGSFGYEKEHYSLSQAIGETTLFPYLRALGENDIVIASGHSCRHQIEDGVNHKAVHLSSYLYARLI